MEPDDADATFNSSYFYETVEERINFTINTCVDYLRIAEQYNISLSTIGKENGAVFQRDDCNRSFMNISSWNAHPAKYAVIATYPIFLLMCTIGNILNIIVIRREKAVRRTKRWSADVYLVALAISDMAFMWGQLIIQLGNIDAATSDPKIGSFIRKTVGGSTFLSEMFLNSSDWILIGFSAERLIAVAFPLTYGRFVSRKRTIITVCCIFFLGFLSSVYNLWDYYYFYVSDDPRCPAVFFKQPDSYKLWHEVQRFSVILIPLVNFLVILALNSIVAAHLLIRREFRTLNARTSGSSDDTSRDGYAVQLLLATAFFYILMQAPLMVWNLWEILRNYPFCYAGALENVGGVFGRLTSVAINANYSFNFFLYYGVSSSFRKGCRELFCRKEFSILDRSNSRSAMRRERRATVGETLAGRKGSCGLLTIAPSGRRSLESLSSRTTLVSTVPLNETFSINSNA